MLFYRAVRRFTACLLHIFKREKTYHIAVSVLGSVCSIYFFFLQFWFHWAGVQTFHLAIFHCSGGSITTHFTLSFWDVWLREVFAFYSCLHSTHAGCQCVPQVWPVGNLHKPQLRALRRAPVMHRHKKELWKKNFTGTNLLSLPTDEPTRIHFVSAWQEIFWFSLILLRW